MAFIPRARPAAVTFNLTPMIDVTFQLLIFFVCANTWSYVESAEKRDLTRPIASAEDIEETGSPRFTINLRDDGKVGEILVRGRAATAEELFKLLQVARKEHQDRLDVLIRADRRVPYARLQSVFAACSQARIPQVRLAVKKKDE